MEQNDVKPIKDTHFKIFVEKDGVLYWPIRSLSGQISWGDTKVEGKVQICPRCSPGLHVWRFKKDAMAFAKWISLCPFLNLGGGKIVIKKVKCAEHLRSGLAKVRNKKKGFDFLDSVFLRGQAFSFQKIEVFD